MFKTLSSSNKSEQNTTNPSLLCPSSSALLTKLLKSALSSLPLLPNLTHSQLSTICLPSHHSTEIALPRVTSLALRSLEIGGTGLYCWPLHPQGWLTAGTKYIITAFSGAFILLITFELSSPFHPITRFL